jgi:hypothetical protein
VGSIWDSQLRGRKPSPSEPRPVGRLTAPEDATATLISAGPNWSFAYGGEIPIRVRLHDIEFLPIPDRKNLDCLFWSGMSVQIRPPVQLLPDPLRAAPLGLWISAALRPASFYWQVAAPLKPGLDKHSTSGWERELQRLANGEIGMNDLPFDPFEPDPGIWTARLADPVRTYGDGQQGEDGFEVRRSPNRRARHRKHKSSSDLPPAGQPLTLLPRQWTFGLAAGDPALAADAIQFAMEESVFEATWKQLRAGAITFRPHRGKTAHPKPGSRKAAASEPMLDWQDRSSMGRMDPALPEQGSALDLQARRAAILQSLAGRVEDESESLRIHIRRHYLNILDDLYSRRNTTPAIRQPRQRRKKI